MFWDKWKHDTVYCNTVLLLKGCSYRQVYNISNSTGHTHVGAGGSSGSNKVDSLT